MSDDEGGAPPAAEEKPKMSGEWLEEVLGEHPTAEASEKWLPLILSRSEALALADCPTLEPAPRAALRALYASGMRQEELLALTPERLNADNNTVLAGERWVVVDSDTLQQLQLVIPWSLTAEDLQGSLECAARATGVWARFEATGRVLLPKALRHSFATHCLENGVDLFSVHALLGHQRMETTEMYIETAISRWLGAYEAHHPLASQSPEKVLRGGSQQAFLSEDETITLIEAADTQQNKLVSRTLYASGLRVHELTSLLVADLVLEESRIFVRRGKGDIDRYTVIDEETARQLGELVAGQPMSARVFPLNDRYVERQIEQAAKACGLDVAHPGETISPHTFRHAHANHCYHRGIDLFALKKLLGHAYLANTLLYVDCRLPQWRKAYDAFHPLALKAAASKLNIKTE